MPIERSPVNSPEREGVQIPEFVESCCASYLFTNLVVGDSQEAESGKWCHGIHYRTVIIFFIFPFFVIRFKRDNRWNEKDTPSVLLRE